MISDWIAMGRAKGIKDAIPWYLKNKDEMYLHSETRKLVEIELGIRVAIPKPKKPRA